MAPAIHGSISEMLDPDYALRRIRWTEVGPGDGVDRPSTHLVGVMSRQENSLVWPADAYDVVLDDEFGILLRIAAISRESVIAEARLVDLILNQPIDDRVFAANPPSGARWLEV